MRKVLIATKNPGKLEEFRLCLADLPFQLTSLKEEGIDQDVEEDGATFADNALKKARFYHTLTGLPTLADDGGLELDFLNGEPGVHSRRWLGYEMSDEELIATAIEKMKNAPADQLGCQFRTVVAFVSGEMEKTAEAVIRGVFRLPPHPKRIPGYPFRSFFFFPEAGKYFVELNEADHARYNHRRKAILEIKPHLETL